MSEIRTGPPSTYAHLVLASPPGGRPSIACVLWTRSGAWANDACYADVFAEQLRSFLRKDDVVLAFSASGNSPNVLNALALAQEIGAFTMGLTGFQGGKMKALCQRCVVIPSENMQVIEDLHLSVAHSIFTSLRARIAELTSPRLLTVAASSRGSC